MSGLFDEVQKQAASPGFGEKFLPDVQHTVDRLRTHPELGVDVAAGLRRVLLHRFPFSLVYPLESEGILIVSVAHHRRRPGYWRLRNTR